MARDVILEAVDRPLERGGMLRGDRVSGRLYGPDGGPLIVVMGGISASRHVADDPARGRGWWSTLVHDGGPIDTARFQVLGYDFAPNDDCGEIPESITTGDQAARLKNLLDHIGIRPAALIGSSYGGMTALSYACRYPDALGALCIIGAAHRPYPIGVGWRGIQRRIVRLGIEAGRPKSGLKLARELAMTTYRTPEEFADRFELSETGQGPSRFDICDYLGSRGDAFAEHMDAKRFLAMSESIDLHRVSPEDIQVPTLLMTAISDQLAPLPNMRELRDRLGGPSELYTFNSFFGHDAFLKEYDMMSPKLAEFCDGLTT